MGVDGRKMPRREISVRGPLGIFFFFFLVVGCMLVMISDKYQLAGKE